MLALYTNFKIMPSQNMIPIEHVYTNEICSALATARLNQQFEPLIVPDGSPITFMKMVLVLQLNKSYISSVTTNTVYHSDNHILGKALRLLVFLEEKFSLFTLIEPYNVRSIMVTTAADPQQMNNRNKWVLETGFARTTTRQLIQLKHHNVQIYEAAIASLVAENRI